MRYLQGLSRGLGRAVPLAWSRRAASRLLDLLQGLDTTRIVALEDLGVAHQDRVHYTPSSWLTLSRISHVIPFSRDDTFVDFGSGKGRVVIMAARYFPFKRVIGVEISAELNNIARVNVERSFQRLKCRQIDLITSDALKYQIPQDMTIAYFYSPFTGAVFKGVMDRIRISLKDRKDRRLWIVLVRPIASPRIAVFNECDEVLRASSWLQRIDLIIARSHSISIYRAIDG